jgi:hypothetical protein
VPAVRVRVLDSGLERDAVRDACRVGIRPGFAEDWMRPPAEPPVEETDAANRIVNQNTGAGRADDARFF